MRATEMNQNRRALRPTCAQCTQYARFDASIFQESSIGPIQPMVGPTKSSWMPWILLYLMVARESDKSLSLELMSRVDRARAYMQESRE